MKKVLVTGASGFIGKNLLLWLHERRDIAVETFTRADEVLQLREKLNGVDLVFHLAGVNRPEDPQDFKIGNEDLTQALCHALIDVANSSDRKISVIYASSTQAALENAYGKSKRAAEAALEKISSMHAIPVHIARLPNVFGKWCRPNYNSAVATFCHNVAHNLPITVHDSEAQITLAYIDDVIEYFIRLMDGGIYENEHLPVLPYYTSSVGDVASHIQSFRTGRSELQIERVGNGLIRALYSTYISYLPVELFSYSVTQHSDARGVFVEMLKTPDCGQFSFFSALPGVTRGGHYHHTKTEKFLVVKGDARFRFKNMLTGQFYELYTSGDDAKIVETIPGWSHDITNVGSHEMIVMLWANEIFDRSRPDTFPCPL
ncbi:NAD-dependent epimerase/dehydratase family protein [Microvirgula aerodenitrificans]|uniref:UDP-2-acetamido-2,6-beta-L-arabino-hexul-4-ose reductase n=1 Tax=Microvirgula aerodenitrificans TaxID=57480 RepID=UPI0028E9D14B|nr:NAD-dependent epimerase/dehydratase family protein [Microvirgula aerodenitrificans]